MPLHARPHLTTHTRGHGHSAVAGAAYRLGLRLRDQRTGEWHDYRKRQAGDEIVRAITVAPPGAPGWATDPDRLWNEVEAAELRKDAQVARDFRVPIPFGLSDKQAGDLAEELALYIATTLGTAVSMGLHRDAERDALGELKADDGIGFHAHLYFPTRQLQCWTGEGAEPSDLGFGSKLKELAYKRTSGPVVELLNERWAEIANDHLREAGLTPDRDHRSYAKLGIDKVREPKIGQAATALERRGVFTDKGDAVRQIRVPSESAKVAHQALLAHQRTQARSDRERETSVAQPARVRDEVAEAQERGQRLGGQAALVDRFAAALPAPAPTTRATFVKLLAVIRHLQRVLLVLTGVVPRLETAAEARRRTTLAHWQAQRDLDALRPRHAAAQSAVQNWLQEHPWRVRFREAMGAPRPRPLLALEQREAQERKRLKEADRDERRSGAQDEASLRRLRHLQRLQGKAEARLERGLAHLAYLDPGAVGILREVATVEQRQFMDRAMPDEPQVEDLTPEVGVPMPEVAVRPRPRPRMG